MKRIEIPLTNKKDVEVKESNEVISSYKSYSIKELLDKYLDDEITTDELLYIYDIYNMRRMANIYNYFDFENDCFMENMQIYKDNDLGSWIMNEDNYAKERATLFVLKNILMPFRDYARIFDCDPLEITNDINLLSNDPSRYVVFVGSIYDDSVRISYPNLKYVSGDVNFEYLRYADGLSNLMAIDGDMLFYDLEDGNPLNNLISVGGDAYLNSLTTGLENLRSVGMNLDIYADEMPKLNNLEFVGGSLADINPKQNISLQKLRFIGDDLSANDYESIMTLSSLEYIGRDIYLDGEHLDGEEVKKILRKIKNNR